MMIYDFVAKIKRVENKEALDEEALQGLVVEVNKNFSIPLDYVRFVLADAEKTGELLVRSKASVSSMPSLHDKELENAVEAFIAYLEAVAKAVQGEISRTDGFYNNNTSFKRLFS